MEKRYIEKRELAEMLGYCERSIMRFVDRGALPKPIYINKQPRWRLAEVEEFLAKKQKGGNEQ